MSEQHGNGWACSTCATPNRGGNRFCVRCGAAHGGGRASRSTPDPRQLRPPPPVGGLAGAHPPPGAPDAHASGSGGRAVPFGAGPPPTDPAQAPGGTPPAAPERPGTGRVVLIVAALVVVAIVAGVGLGLALTRDGTRHRGRHRGRADGRRRGQHVRGAHPRPSARTDRRPPPVRPPRRRPPLRRRRRRRPHRPPPHPRWRPHPPPAGGPFDLGTWIAVRVSLRQPGRGRGVPRHRGAGRERSSAPTTTLADAGLLGRGHRPVRHRRGGRRRVLRPMGMTDPDQCFGAPLTASPGDRELRAYPD